MKKSLLLLLFLFSLIGLNAQATLEGKIVDKETKEPLFANVALYSGQALVTGTQADFDGNYLISNVDAKTYDVEVSIIGYATTRKTGVVLKAGQIIRLDFEMSVEGEMLDEVVIEEYKAPLIDVDNTSSGGTVTAEKIQNLPTKSVTSIVASTAGVSSQDGGGMSFRGGRTNANVVIVDGVRVSANSIPQSEIEQIQVITGGMAAKYGDAIGGLTSITTKGPSQRFAGGVELETSQYLDPYGYNLVSTYLSGPILKKDGMTRLGFRFSGQYNYLEDDNPSAIGRYRAPESVIERLTKEPLVNFRSSKLPAGTYLSNKDVGESWKTTPNEDYSSLSFTGKIEARPVTNMDLSLSGSFVKADDRFTPSESWGLLNWINNPYSKSTRYNFSFRLRHKIGKQGLEVKEEDKGKSISLIRNAYYSLTLGYEKAQGESGDFRHKDNFFNYGYYGKQETNLIPFIDTVNAADFTDCVKIDSNCYAFKGYTQSVQPFEPNTDINPGISLYNKINGDLNSTYQTIWSNLYSNVGQVYGSYSKSENEGFSARVSAGFDFLPGGSRSGRHSIELGLMAEMRINRYWSISPIGLWELARELQNSRIIGVDNDIVIDTIDLPTGKFPVYQNKLDDDDSNGFYDNVRKRFGLDTFEHVFVDDRFSPDQLSLDLFSARELNDKRLVGYAGYDYLGNKLSNDVTFSDFFTKEGHTDFRSPANNPLYGSVYIQDKFSFKDIIMRIGARVDYYDANTKVLKDPYSLYEIENAKDFYANYSDLDKPESVGDDYKVYVADRGSNQVVGFRKGDTWYLPNGIATNGNMIFRGGLVYPFYKERDELKRNIQADEYDINNSFEDYKPQINFMPRIAFSFPISEDAGFFAHYDVLVQRPSSGNFMTPMSYYYFQSSGSGTYGNPNLKPERTIDYEVGFQQKLTGNSALKIQAYYREMRDMIRYRPYLFVPYVTKYSSYGNLDYGTVKGFSFTYDFRRKGNIEFQVAYTLQFAFSTGSDANSSAGTSTNGIVRNLYPLNTDERHSVSALIDYRYFGGKKYNGPEVFGYRIFENAGVNLQLNATSGRPYTKAFQSSQFGGSGYVGAINGARKPWYFEANVRLDKTFYITDKLMANVYLRFENILNLKNVVGVYSYSGDPDDDGYLVSTFGQNRIQKIVEQGLPLENFYDMYSWRLAAPWHYSRPRRIYLGVVFNF